MYVQLPLRHLSCAFFFFQSQALVFVKCDITGGHPGLDPNLAGLVAVVVAALV